LKHELVASIGYTEKTIGERIVDLPEFFLLRSRVQNQLLPHERAITYNLFEDDCA
jgi:hypothetical protein